MFGKNSTFSEKCEKNNSISGVALERVLWVPVNPLIFQISYKVANESVKISRIP